MATSPHPGDQFEVPGYEAHASPATLKDRIKQHYEIASDYYYSLWGRHIHHGLFKSPTETKEEAQLNLIEYLLEISALPDRSEVLDVGCGIGGTSCFLAKEQACRVTGITISGKQVEIAKRLTLAETSQAEIEDQSGFISYQEGKVRFIELDAEKMLDHFSSGDTKKASFDCVWVSEALSHFPNKPLFFSSAEALLAPGGGRLVIADWFKAPGLSPEQENADVKPIEDGMLLPKLCTADDYVRMAEAAGFKVKSGPIDISKSVAKTWDISWSLVSSPSLWAFAIAQGRDGLAFLQAFRAMRRGYANGTFRFAVMCFEKP
ncbi:Uu.00g061650.m01.CDS01 [Anthostomella pinea]|uniref:Uu.00g061650.m01.CDS01 n=1 Tax=Anthostomella pinea TaxID=933095 RepID=A0AAI8YMP5_9PEZI|nr:Uu.00g061650.m01.CDS01 [Anthostomella pinea]